MADSSFEMISPYFDIEFPEDSKAPSALVYICPPLVKKHAAS